jgi:spermidine synthase
MMVLFLIPGFIYAPDRPDDLLYRTESEYNIISVYDNPDYRMLKLDSEWFYQSYMSKRGPLTGKYYDVYSVGPLMNNAKNVLWLGMSGGTSVKQLLYFHDVEIDAVEIDLRVVDVAREYFNVTEGDGLRIFVMDGRQFLRESGSYDIINVDVFSGGSGIPFHMATLEFFDEASEHLTDSGLLMMNVIAYKGDRSVGNSIAYTMKRVFPSVFIIDFRGNMILVACKNRRSASDLINGLRGNDNPLLDNIILSVTSSLHEFNSAEGTLLTDDKSKIEELTFNAQKVL